MLEAIANLLVIFRESLTPILLLIACGFWLQRRFSFDMRTLSRLNMWFFVPALAIHALSHAEMPVEYLFQVAGFVLMLQGVLYLVTLGWAKVRGYAPSLTAAFACSVIFYNSGNFGLPLIELLYGKGSTAVGLQAIVLAVQNATTFSLGQVIIRGRSLGFWKALSEYFRMPFPYAVGLGLLLQLTGWQLWGPIDKAVAYAAGGLVPIALVTLGAQLACVELTAGTRSALASASMRLLGGPLVAYLLLRLLGWEGLLAQHLMIASAVPTAVNSALLAIEFDSEAGFASRAVMVSTVLSSLTVAVVIYAARLLFPL